MGKWGNGEMGKWGNGEERYQLDARHPFVDGEFILARKVVQVLYQARSQLARSRRSFGSCSIDDRGREVWVELVRLISGHGFWRHGS